MQYGWETITEALKWGGITGMMDRLSNPAKIKAHELSLELKKIMTPSIKNIKMTLFLENLVKR